MRWKGPHRRKGKATDDKGRRYEREDPCEPESRLEDIERATGRPCPRVELDPELWCEGRLVHYAVNEELRGFADEALRALVPPEQRRLVLSRVEVALGHAQVVEARRIAFEEEMEERTAQARRKGRRG